MPEPEPAFGETPDPNTDVRARAWRFLHSVERLDAGDLERVALPAADVRVRATARADAHGAVRRAGLVRLESETRGAARDMVDAAFVGELYQPTMFGLNWGRSTGRVQDRVAVITAVEDAALATVGRDVIPPEAYDELMEAFLWIEPSDRTDRPIYADTGMARWTRPLAATILGGIALILVLASIELGFPGMLSVVIPVALVIAIVASLARRRPASGRR